MNSRSHHLVWTLNQLVSNATHKVSRIFTFIPDWPATRPKPIGESWTSWICVSLRPNPSLALPGTSVTLPKHSLLLLRIDESRFNAFMAVGNVSSRKMPSLGSLVAQSVDSYVLVGVGSITLEFGSSSSHFLRFE